MKNEENPSESQRNSYQYDATLGFLGFFSAIFVLQATINVFQAEPKVWPAVLALISVLATVAMWRSRRR